MFLVTLAAGLALAVPELLINRFIGPELSVIVSSIVIMAVIIVGAKILPPNDPSYSVETNAEKVSAGEGVRAAMPFILIFVLLLLTSKLFPAISGPLATIKTSVPIYMGPGAKPYTFAWIGTPGIMIFIAAFIGGAVQKASFGEMLSVLGRTFKGLQFTYITIITVVMTAKIMAYSGMTANIADALVAATGTLYPAFAPVIGALGSFLTGSGTNSNVLFGPLQIEAAKGLQPGNDNLRLWLAAISSASTGIGKMLAPQSIAIAVGAVVPALEGYLKENNIDAEETKHLRDELHVSTIMIAALKYSLFLLVIAGVISYFGQALIPNMHKLFGF